MDQIADPTVKEDFNSASKSIDDRMYEEKTRMYALAYEQQFHYAVFYAYMKLKEQEIRNIFLLAELVQLNIQKNAPTWKKVVIPFKDVY